MYTVVWPMGKSSEILPAQNRVAPDLSPAYCFSLQLLTPQDHDYSHYSNLLDIEQSKAWVQSYLQRCATFRNSVSVKVNPKIGQELNFSDENVHQPVVADTSPIALEEVFTGIGKALFFKENTGSERYFLALGKRDLAELSVYTAPTLGRATIASMFCTNASCLA